MNDSRFKQLNDEKLELVEICHSLFEIMPEQKVYLDDFVEKMYVLVTYYGFDLQNMPAKLTELVSQKMHENITE